MFTVIIVQAFLWAQWSDIAESMDKLNLQVLVNLSGGSGSSIASGVETIQESSYQDRMVFFSSLDFRGGVGPGLVNVPPPNSSEMSRLER
ncbi:MAG: hypothetical protein Ct9H300mP25_02710 [Acidobacteriota bacterium]|nr:MAG: hypothetical protein Ct9H300mP25_02710 [Acidobacteriota bacterium]